MRAVTGLRTVCVFGGASREEQAALLTSKQPHVLVATPGRVLDLVDGGELKLQGSVQYLVLDEADKMLSLGFKPQLDRLYGMLLQPYDKSADDGAANLVAAAKKKSAKAKVLLFSATMPTDVAAAAAQWLRLPEIVQVSACGANAISRTVTQVVHVCAEHKKPDKLLKHLARIRDSVPAGSRNPPRLLVFANRVKTVRFLAATLAKEGYKVAQLHGQRSQAERNQAVSDFRSGKAQVLVATDVAARGLDIRALPYVVNYDFPSRLETYVHRVGRTGRLAAYGHAYSFFTRNLAPLAPPLLELLQTHGQAVDPNLAALAAAWKVAEEKLGRKGAAAAAAAAARSADGTAVPADGAAAEDESGEEDDDEGDGAAAADSGLTLAEEVLLAADDLMEGLGPQDARAIAALVKKKLSRKQQQKLQQASSAGEEGHGHVDVDDEDGDGDGDDTRPSKKQQRGGEEQGVGGARVITNGAEVEAVGRAKKKKAAGDVQLVPMSKEQQRQAVQRREEQKPGGDGGLQRAAAFVSAAAFKGAMAGYVFKKGPLGLGYYLDQHQQKQGQQQAAAGQRGKAAPLSAAAAVPGLAKRSTAPAATAPATAAAAVSGKGVSKAAAGQRGNGTAASAWGLPSRNKPIIPVRHSDFLSDSESGGGPESDPDSDWDVDLQPSPPVPFRNAIASSGGVKGMGKAKAKSEAADGTISGDRSTEGGRPGHNSRGDGDDDDDDGDDVEPLEGQRAAAKRRFKSLPGRLRKKLRKGQATGQPQHSRAASGKEAAGTGR
ncbi:hypothetical protein VOLCADRAFT_121455 [Volvox carteri f. nagariensis]|uniref:Uncharacterized protein n=1 Tax=Volvox carteri f. nagariensis TaxID=3068 RepID=D8UAR4_VOLCA|nr:uncharacterized protein VOLCADRAFT_121455 [Volvox carteri f. nagariensis]EFJ43202.1 hypothetical protein VOLCADRAFT_121455 [Volvox carteri f. nagariensis]|eukprot:XP_002955777.1 hypothetical protein VOLCADRAFT_121455 [Volvox carteri f. nagariensis]